jgi:hypothetical protein
MINESKTTTTFIVMDACAKMPNSCWGIYRRVAVLEVIEGTIPAMISKRARGVVRVVATWEKLNVGKTDRCAFSKARAEARALAAQLNAGNGPEWAQG